MNIWRLFAVSVILGWPFNGNAAIRFLPDVDQQDVGVQTEKALIFQLVKIFKWLIINLEMK